jgi:hypothetical protein
MKARLGASAAITAAAHKLARILHHLIKHRVPYDASAFAAEEKLHCFPREKHLHKQAATLGFQLTPIQSNG